MAAFGYSVFASDPASEAALYANTAVAAGLEGGSYQIEVKIPGSVTALASDHEEDGTLTLLLLPAWLEVHPFSVTKRALDTKNLGWASLSLRVPLYSHQVIPKLEVNRSKLESYLPQDLEQWETGRYPFGPYDVFIYNASDDAAFDESVLAEVDAVILVAVSEVDLLSVREAVDWGSPGTWYREQEDGLGNRLRWFQVAQKSGSVSLLFLRFTDLRTLRLEGSIDLPEVPSEVSGRNVRLEVKTVTAGGALRYNAYLIRPAAVKVPVAGLTEVREVVKVETLGSYDSLEEVPYLSQRHLQLKAAVRGAGIGVILVTIGRTGAVAFIQGDAIKGSVYTAATATAVFGQTLGDVPFKKVGARGALGNLKVGTALAAATGTILASYALFKAASSLDSIAQLMYLEQASALTLDTGIILIPGYGTAILGSWTVTVAAMSVLMPNGVASRIVSSPGSSVTFAIEYLFSGAIPSAIAEDAFIQTSGQAISQMRQWNAVFQVPSVVILPPTDR